MSAIATTPQPSALSRAPLLASAERRALAWLSALALAHGLLYMLLLPPWQHYDEPTHFAYAALLAGGDGGRDAQVRLSREIADSMYRHRFWPAGEVPDLLGPQPAQIGSDQRIHPPLYYRIVAGVVAPLQGAPVEAQLYAGRLVGVALYTLTIICFWRVAVTVVPDEPLIQIALPLLALLAPAFADLMSAVNSDALVNFCAAAMLLGCALLIRDGPTRAGLCLALLGLAATLLAKRTAVIAVVPCTLALLWSLRRRPLPWWAYAGSLLGVAAATLLVAFRLAPVETAAGTRLGLAPREWLDALDRAYLRLYIANWLRSVADLERSGPLYLPALGVMIESFWLRLGWGHIRIGLVGGLAAALGLVAVAGLGRWAWAARGEAPLWQRRWVALCVVAAGCALLATLARLHPISPDPADTYLPRGRYMFWAFLPTIWLVALGLQSALPERWRASGPYALLLLFAALDLAGIVAVISYYGGGGG